MKNEFFCFACCRWKPLREKVDRGAGKRPKCKACAARTDALTKPYASPGAWRKRPHTTPLDSSFLRWAAEA